MKYMIGVNYWGSKHGIDMWKYWDEDSVRKDLHELKKYGVKWMRVFPNWRDFQPVHTLYGHANKLVEYRFADDKPIDNEYGLDMEQIAHFRTFCDIAGECGMRFCVGIVTGWMSGRMFAPPVVEGKNHITDPESLKWQNRFVRGFVHYLKDRPEIGYWDLGNESNNLSPTESRAAAWMWTASVRNAILSEDRTRPIMSGMHGLKLYDGPWQIVDQGELTDVLTPHPYPSPTVGGDVDPMNRPRTTLVPTAQVELYAGIGGKPAMMQESGTFSNMIGTGTVAADFLRANLWSGWINGSLGYYWWCAHDQLHLKNPPNTWSMIENELGILKNGYEPKPVAHTMKAVSDAIEAMPFGELPPKQYDGVCVLPKDLARMEYVADAVYTLAKQANIDLRFCDIDHPIPEAAFYVIPSANGWAPMKMDVLYALEERVKAGASLLFTTANGLLAECERFFGLVSRGMRKDNRSRVMHFDGAELPFRYETRFMMEGNGAEILAADEDGTVIFSRNPLGKGWFYFLNFPLETYTFGEAESYVDYPYWKIYAAAAEGVLAEKPVISQSENVAVTIHPTPTGFLAAVMNYDKFPAEPALRVAEGIELTRVYGEGEKIPPTSPFIYQAILK